MILIYSQHTTRRLIYVLDFIFKAKNQDYMITQSIDEFNTDSRLKINYSTIDLIADLTIKPESLLFETAIRSSINVAFDTTTESWTINNSNDSFALIFFFLTCYEEYYIYERDEHDRFSAKNSTLLKNERLHKPNADLIVMTIWSILNLDYSKIKANYKSIITFDIDSAWAVKNKSKIRSIGSDLKSVINRESLAAKKAIRKGEVIDPFDTFDLISSISEKNDVVCFFLLGDWGEFDKNIDWKNENLQYLIKDLSSKLKVGIHPSYKSYLSSSIVKSELGRLDVITGSKNNRSRQHFLKLKLPESYEILDSIGIKEDYSMGFADAYGFRAGTSFPYTFFNLAQNSVSELTIFPITYMDGTLNQYLKLSIEESIIIIKKLKTEIKNTGGIFIPLWHNETIGEQGIWKGWTKVFESNFDT